MTVLQRQLAEALAQVQSLREARAQKPHVLFRSNTDRRDQYLAALQTTGNHQLASDLVGVHVRTPRKLREDDEEFDEDCEVAEERFRQVRLVTTAVRRAVDGCDEPIYQGGRLVGWKRVYSDRLLEQQLRARGGAEYRDKVGLEHSGGLANVQIQVPPAMTPAEYAAFVATVMQPAGIAPARSPDHDPATSDDDEA